MAGLAIRKLADTSTGTRVKRYDPETGASFLLNPETGQPEPWPFAGVRLDQAPEVATISTSKVAEGIAEGWLEGVNGRPVVRPAGPTQTDWNSSHTGQPHVFLHYDALVFKTVDGDITYTVAHQPDKYADHGQAADPDQVDAFDGDDDTPVTPEYYAAGATRVDHFYGIVKES